MERPPRVLFFGMQGNFSFPALHALLESGVEVCAVVVPSSSIMTGECPALYQPKPLHFSPPQRSQVPMLNAMLSANIRQLAWTHAIPLWEVTRLSDPETVAVLAAYHPDTICVSCFSQRIPRAILDIPQLGCLNVHPALLPANRGPVPLFWTFREGDEQTGVTIHLMGEGMDSGDILEQRSVPVPHGISYVELESRCSQLGGALLAEAVWKLFSGQAVRIPQDEAKSGYHSFPTEEDYIVPVAEWSAEHVYNFICGVGTWGGPVKLYSENEVFETRQCVSYSHHDLYKQNKCAYFEEDAVLWLRCKKGWVGVQL